MSISTDLINYEVFEYSPLADLYPHIQNPRFFQLFREQVRKRTLSGSIEPLEVAVANNDERMMECILRIIAKLPEAQTPEYWKNLFMFAINHRSPILVRLIGKVLNNPKLFLKHLRDHGEYTLVDMIVDHPDLLDEYLSLPRPERIININKKGELEYFGDDKVDLQRILQIILSRKGIEETLRVFDYLADHNDVSQQDVSLVIRDIMRRIIPIWMGMRITEEVERFLLDDQPRKDIISLLESPNTTARDLLNLLQQHNRYIRQLSSDEIRRLLVLFEQILSPEKRQEILRVLEIFDRR